MLKLFLFSLTLVAVSAEEPYPIVTIECGTLKGSWKLSTKNRTYASFEGVPYAQPPVEEYRFKEPQPREPWVGVWDATRQLPPCLQYDTIADEILGSENCLHVNVYTSNLRPQCLLPVIVYIHGGANVYGAGNLYGPQHLMDKDMVVVTVNYRLGPLGYLSTEDEIIPGNYGLKDQSCALHWIQNNIKKFGGDPDNVLLTGGSAGAAAVSYHYISPLSRGTFKRGIVFSGVAIAPWAYERKSVEKAKRLASIIGCPSDTSQNILDCLRDRPAETIVNAQLEFLEWRVKYSRVFGPTIEGPGVERPFLTQYPYHAITSGAIQKSPLIACVTTEDGLYPAAAYYSEPGLLDDLEANWTRLSSNIFSYRNTLPPSRQAKVAAKIKRRYLDNKPVSDETFPELVQALTDRLYLVEGGRLAEIHAEQSGQPTYLYIFGYRATFSFSWLLAKNKEDYGVSHADDVVTIFKYDTDLPTPTAEDVAMREQLLNMVYSFATTGVPKLSDDSPEWTPLKPGSKNINFLQILSPEQAEMKSSSDFGQRSFWDSLGFIENDRFNFQT